MPFVDLEEIYKSHVKRSVCACSEYLEIACGHGSQITKWLAVIEFS